ncbi:PREDICTED: facilitated trehalose transporter Tret1-like isoform X1 [Acromyrmex echinatior]|uniref:facilitated trehalose transporter Tret1-like isoform X1 n=1 Tax=Acromyrmex echinatior TaxID=103372 RepID=UPI000580B8DC|nr:PREDICTED: facilitated trehalose transporter Tret1-like isoform X1 [Acromyrmex echinatior]
MVLIAQSDERSSCERPTSKCAQYVGVLVATLAAFSIGTHLSWTSSALPLYNTNDTLSVSDQEGSWISSLVPLGAIPTAIPTGMFADRIGRKKTIWMTTVPLFLCWYIIGFAQSKIWIFLARFVAGAACGAASVVVPMFVSEIAEQSIRGFSSIIFQLQITAGILFAYSTAFTDSLHVIAILCSVAPALLLIFFPFVPESPAWLVMQGQKNEANIVLKHLRGIRYSTEAELTRLEFQASEMREIKPNISDLKNYQKATYIILGLMFFQQLSGVNILIFYAKKIFDDAGSILNSSTSSVIIGVVQVIGTYFSTVLIERVGRKLLLFISASVMAVCMFTMSGYFRFQSSHDLSSFSWIPLLSFAVFIVIFSIGFAPVPWLMVGELFTNNVKSVANIAVMCNWTLAFLVTKCFQDMVNLMGISSSFAAFGMISLIGTIFVSVMVPETKGRSFEEIQIELYGTQIRIPTEDPEQRGKHNKT